MRSISGSHHALLHDLIAHVYDNWAGTETIAVFQENLGRDFYQARREAGKAYTARLESRGVVTAEEAAYWKKLDWGIV